MKYKLVIENNLINGFGERLSRKFKFTIFEDSKVGFQEKTKQVIFLFGVVRPNIFFFYILLFSIIFLLLMYQQDCTGDYSQQQN